MYHQLKTVSFATAPLPNQGTELEPEIRELDTAQLKLASNQQDLAWELEESLRKFALYLTQLSSPGTLLVAWGSCRDPPFVF